MIKERCLYIYDRRPYSFDTVIAAGETLSIQSEGRILDNGVMKADSDIYSCMVYDKCRIITIISKGLESSVSNLIFRESADYDNAVRKFKDDLGLKISVQDGKVISYARSISEKLRAGIEVNIFDAVNEEDFIVCPACGVKNDRNSGFDFCLECGEPLK